MRLSKPIRIVLRWQLVATAVALSLRGRVGPVPRALLAVAAIATYSLLVGLQPSVLRAALMATVAACGTIAGRTAASAGLWSR